MADLIEINWDRKNLHLKGMNIPKSRKEKQPQVLEMPSLESLRSSLHRARHKNTLILPAHRRYVSLFSRFTKTISDDDFLLVNDRDDDKIMIFSTEENLRLMTDVKAFYMDGTFSTCPALFYKVCYISSNHSLVLHSQILPFLLLIIFYAGFHNPHPAVWLHLHGLLFTTR